MPRLVLKQLTCNEQEDFTGTDTIRLCVTPAGAAQQNIGTREMATGHVWQINASIPFERHATVELFELDATDGDDLLGSHLVPHAVTTTRDNPWHAFTGDGARYTLTYRIEQTEPTARAPAPAAGGRDSTASPASASDHSEVAAPPSDSAPGQPQAPAADPWFPTLDFPAGNQEVAAAFNNEVTIRTQTVVAMVHANYGEHATNLRHGINAAGHRTAGCKWCYEKLLADHFGGIVASLGTAWTAYTDQQKLNLLGPIKQAHVLRVTAHPGESSTMPDLNWMWTSADAVAERVGADVPPGYAGPRARRLTSLDDARAHLKQVYENVGEIQMVASVGHGFTNAADLGTRLPNADIAGFLNGEPGKAGVAQYLAEDIRWIFYHCLTAGSEGNNNDRPVPFAMTNPAPFAEQFRSVLAQTKPNCEVWGHLGAGDATMRPYWVRFRANGAVSLFDHCDGEPGRWGPFRGRLERLFEGQGFADGLQGIVYLPMWPVDFEDTSLRSLYQALP